MITRKSMHAKISYRTMLDVPKKNQSNFHIISHCNEYIFKAKTKEENSVRVDFAIGE